jgi:hypothetical protein
VQQEQRGRIVVDTAGTHPAACAATVVDRLATVTGPKAFDRLRDRRPLIT